MNNSNLQSENKTIEYLSLFDPKYEIGVRMQDKNIAFAKHFHNYVEIVWQIDGESIHCIDDNEIILHANEIIIINPKNSHTNMPSNSNTLNLIISKNFLMNFVSESAFDLSAIHIKDSILYSIHLNKYQLTNNSIHILQKIFTNFTEKKDLYYYKQKLLISQFLITFHEETEINIKNPQKENINLISYIQKDLANASLNEYAKINNYSSSLMSQRIKTEYNMTFIEILKELRLKTAVILLVEGNMKIDKIIEEVGYQNKTHFYEIFKSKYHMTPKQYKKEINKS